MNQAATPIEFRSDTFTKPSEAMLQAMFSASVGDDVFGEDASVNALERSVAEFFGMEAGLFCPSGTMTNQIAIQVHTQPGDEVICESRRCASRADPFGESRKYLQSRGRELL